MWKHVLALSLFVSSVALAGEAAPAAKPSAVKAEAKAAPAEHDALKLVTIDEVATLLEKQKTNKKAVTVVDVNSEKTRQESGFVPGAILLPGSDYDLALLPKDKAQTTIFYCANEKCMASHRAAKKAIDAGYTNVVVMSEGIQGWVKAAKPIEKPKAAKVSG